MLFKIGNTDFTKCIVANSYSVNRKDVYFAWEDANGTAHRTLKRQKISGSLSLYMRSAQYQAAFTQALEQGKQPGGFYIVTATVNGVEQDLTFNAFLDCDLTRKTVGVRDTFNEFELRIEER